MGVVRGTKETKRVGGIKYVADLRKAGSRTSDFSYPPPELIPGALESLSEKMGLVNRATSFLEITRLY